MSELGNYLAAEEQIVADHKASLVATFEPETGEFATTTAVNNGFASTRGEHQNKLCKRQNNCSNLNEPHGLQVLPRRGSTKNSSNFGAHISQVFALRLKSANYLFAYMLFVNLLMSMLNTFLLSFIVKSLQSNERVPFEVKQHLLAASNNNHLQGSLLELPSFLARDKSISANSIGQLSGGERALIIENWPQETRGESRQGGSIQVSACEPMMENVKPESGANAQLKQEHRLPENECNSMRISRRGLELATKALFMNVLPSVAPLASGSKQNVGAQHANRAHSQSGASAVHLARLAADERARYHHSTTASTSGSHNNNNNNNNNNNKKQERSSGLLLEFNAERQSITLPLTNRFTFARTPTTLGQLRSAGQKQEIGAKSGAAHLIVNGQLNCAAELSGTLGHHLDVQSGSANLSCRSQATLGLVSRSADLNLVASEQLRLAAGTVHLGAPKTNRFYLLGALQCYDERPAAPGDYDDNDEAQIAQLREASKRPTAANNEQTLANLQALNLMLVDGLLMASRDQKHGA